MDSLRLQDFLFKLFDRACKFFNAFQDVEEKSIRVLINSSKSFNDLSVEVEAVRVINHFELVLSCVVLPTCSRVSGFLRWCRFLETVTFRATSFSKAVILSLNQKSDAKSGSVDRGFVVQLSMWIGVLSVLVEEWRGCAKSGSIDRGFVVSIVNDGLGVVSIGEGVKVCDD
ncbi:hypothetical protein Tco_1016117 [Tanacetum coccineum]|uniref:Uncharacterized protein n=1 Tax=Tanacetum coccineum TaxID=301880 RepID=A0ABQ5FMR9_9ASTR